ncbi:hypothetical protein TREMEDRAFT_44314 [Tremella mesenterica DSM 1558]|uniref:uncharacterized protein n=1 Tax=Tremella mesenterica (strain ATCC 24925 / CBS 8224 / DSM 1558 / NBRC 9311 / NRRL Y-6157 / RJB 2259-6 / UBC 559-6) TaxID=578456 RepID=UPI0003F49D76|nr:uncharacterized protein TREMEDRAFT_44314 [Tremella mesenterica DSM 1558]EIW69112.1 hypothetical protein TREMEDRAFT_44314 [Tremella mesenterica DSM 1558]
MSIVLYPPPTRFPLSPSPSPPVSQSSTPTPTLAERKLPLPSSRPSTPPPTMNLAPISAPPTPVTPTHLFSPSQSKAMERCRSSEARLTTDSTQSAVVGRSGRGTQIKATSLLFKSVPSREQIAATEKNETGDEIHVSSMGSDADQKMEVDQQTKKEMENKQGGQMEGEDDEKEQIWGMPKWGWEEERKQIRPGVRLISAKELPVLVDQHAMIDTPSHVLFPWLHGISDDGAKGRDMAAFFGHFPPFAPPPYRGLCVLLCPPHPLDRSQRPSKVPSGKSQSSRSSDLDLGSNESSNFPSETAPARNRSETVSTSSESWASSAGTTEGTSPSIADWVPPSQSLLKPSDSVPPTPTSPSPFTEIIKNVSTEITVETDNVDVAMHPCESKKVLSAALAQGLGETHHPLPCGGSPCETDSETDEAEDQGPSCVLLNSLHVQDIFDLPTMTKTQPGTAPPRPRFKPARLPQQINLRNLNIQQIKYATISDIIIYAKGGLGHGVLEVAEQIALAQHDLWQQRMEGYYRSHGQGQGEGFGEPVRYGVWIVVEPFDKIQETCPHLVNLDYHGRSTPNSALTDLFAREAIESRAMTRGSEVVEGFWVGNNCDVPGGAEDGIGSQIQFDLCVHTSELAEMPTSSQLTAAYRKLLDLDKSRRSEDSSNSWTSSPATIALRNLLSPSSSSLTPSSSPAISSVNDVGSKRNASPSDEGSTRQRRSKTSNHEYVSLECSDSCRSPHGLNRNLTIMVDKIVELVYFLRKIIEGRDKSGIKRKVLIHCQDGYTESSILVLSYIMSSLEICLPEAYLYLQNVANRSFFLYPTDKPLLRKIDDRLKSDRRTKLIRLSMESQISTGEKTNSPNSLARWKQWSLGLSPSPTKNQIPNSSPNSPIRTNFSQMTPLKLSHSHVWFHDPRFDCFPSRILPFLYLGNLEHAGNASLLHALGITHVVSVGESLIQCEEGFDPIHGKVGNTLCDEAKSGRIQVLDLCDIRDDGNDPLRPLIARACEWIEDARVNGGKVLVHCRVGVSRSASIVMAYIMQHQKIGLMDAYLLTRARRLNVLIQPNLRFFHELFGWEVELARREGDERRILYSWPSFCRDLHCLNRRFLCN